METQYYFVPIAAPWRPLAVGAQPMGLMSEIGRRLREKTGDSRSGPYLVQRWLELGYSREPQMRELRHAAGGIARYMCRERCALCGARGPQLCGACSARGGTLVARAATAETLANYCDILCASCSGNSHGSCENTECAVLWRRSAARAGLAHARGLLDHIPGHLATGLLNNERTGDN